MPKGDFREVFIRFHSTVPGEMLVPDDLRTRLIEDAEASGSNITDVVVRILAARYRIHHESNGRTGRIPDPAVASVKVRLPIPVHRAAIAAAKDVYPPRTVPDEIRLALCQHYGLEPVGRARVAATA